MASSVKVGLLQTLGVMPPKVTGCPNVSHVGKGSVTGWQRSQYAVGNVQRSANSQAAMPTSGCKPMFKYQFVVATNMGAKKDRAQPIARAVTMN